MVPRVVAVVVTWNRRTLLERILRAVDAQDRRPDEVVVVDNASTDGTPELLERLDGELSTPLHVVRLPRNTGGAGGFHAGIAAATERGADLLWLMDDDGTPPAGCLSSLLGHVDRYDFLGPAVVAEDDPGRLCFPIRIPGTARVVHALADVEAAAVDGVLEGVVIPFNGVLLTGPWSTGSASRDRSSSSGVTTWSTSGVRRGPGRASPRSSRSTSGTRPPTTSGRR